MSFSRSVSSDVVPLSNDTLFSRRRFPSLPTVMLEARDLATKSVVVFKDRAEVKRMIALEQVLSGKTLIRVNNVSPMISRDSIRVEGQRGALILEVQYDETPQLSGCSDSDETEKHLERETAELELRCAELNDQIEVLQRRLEVLDGVAKQIGKNAIVSTEVDSPSRCHVSASSTAQNAILNQQKGKTNFGTNQQQQQQQQMAVAPASLFLLCEDSTKNLTSFLDYYGKTAGETRRELREKNKQMGELKERHVKAEWELNKRRGRKEYDKNKRSIGVLIEVPEASFNVELHLIYHVFGCTWRPAYSLRASTSGGVLNGSVGALKETEEDCSEAVLLCYHGLVEQNSDEDWNDVELILSNALPCSTSAIPSLPTVTAMLQRTALNGFRSRNVSSASSRRKPNSRLATVSQEELDAGIGSFDYNELVDAHHLQQQLQQQQLTRGVSAHGSGSEPGSSSTSAEHAPATYFQVDQHCSIPGDGQQNKVDIAHIELTPTLWHECVPSRLCSAFISAQLVNCSQFPLLPGPLSVFFNNSFTSTSHLKLVLPGEEFRCLLGVDPALKVEYKRAQLSNQQIGFMSRSCLSTNEQIISLRNAKASQSCRVTVREPIPKAADDKVKISLLQPDLKTQRTEARLLAKESQLEWTVKLGPGEQRELSVKWTAEYPAQENVLLTSSSSNNAMAPGGFVPPLASAQLLSGRMH